MPLTQLHFYRASALSPLLWRRLPLLARRLLILSDGATLYDLARILDTLVGDLAVPLQILLSSGLLAAVMPCEAPPLPTLPLYARMQPLPFWLNFLLFGGKNYAKLYYTDAAWHPWRYAAQRGEQDAGRATRCNFSAA